LKTEGKTRRDETKLRVIHAKELMTRTLTARIGGGHKDLITIREERAAAEESHWGEIEAEKR